MFVAAAASRLTSLAVQLGELHGLSVAWQCTMAASVPAGLVVFSCICRAPAALLVPVGQLADLLHELAEGLGAPGEVAADILLQVGRCSSKTV